ncbi:MAG: hypothetical protein WBV82_29525 [Myxococcaceae bacterium]
MKSGLFRGLLCAVAFAATSARADEATGQDAAAAGRAGTHVAAISGPSAVQQNPANLSRMFSLGAVVGAAGVATPGRGLAFPPHLYAGYGNGRMGLALGVNSPGSSMWAGYAGGAWQLTPGLSVGARVSLQGETAGTEGFGWGAAAGVSWAPSERVRFGLEGSLPSLSIPAHLALGTAVFLDAFRLFADAELERREALHAFDVRLGVEKDFGPTFLARAGLLLDQEVSGSERLGVSVGAGRDLGAIEADVAYVLLFTTRTSEFGHVLALTLRFSTPPGVSTRRADTSSTGNGE